MDYAEIRRNIESINEEMERHGVDIIQDAETLKHLELLEHACASFCAQLRRAKSDEEFLITTIQYFGHL